MTFGPGSFLCPPVPAARYGVRPLSRLPLSLGPAACCSFDSSLYITVPLVEELRFVYLTSPLAGP